MSATDSGGRGRRVGCVAHGVRAVMGGGGCRLTRACLLALSMTTMLAACGTYQYPKETAEPQGACEVPPVNGLSCDPWATPARGDLMSPVDCTYLKELLRASQARERYTEEVELVPRKGPKIEEGNQTESE